MQSNLMTTPVSVLSDEEAGILAVEQKMVRIIGGFTDPNTSQTKTAANAALYHLQSGGNRTRARLCINACSSLGVLLEDALSLSACIELLHNASLIHDDLQDQEKKRHGVDSVWTKFSPSIAICAGDLMISSAYAMIASFSNPSLIPSLLSTVHCCISQAIQGQCEDLESIDPFTLPFETYSKVVKAKSGALLSLPLEFALIASDHFLSLSQAKKAAEDFSVGYQIADDLMDIAQDSAADGKPASLNIYFVIQKQVAEELAVETAKSLGRAYFASAHHLAGTLPNQSGQYLQQLASEMSTFL